MSLEQTLRSLPRVFVRQKREVAELFGFETRNKYSIETTDGMQIGYAAEQRSGFFGFVFRQTFGHWRTFTIHVKSPQGQLEFTAHHPFRFYFQRLDVRTADGREIGGLERRFEFFHKRFDVIDRSGRILMTMRSPLWRVWTFPFQRDGMAAAVITKKWGGIVKEAFFDADNFLVDYTRPDLSGEERLILLAAAIFIDLRYFETKAKGGGTSIFDYFLTD